MNTLKISKAEALNNGISDRDFNTASTEPYLKRKTNYITYLIIAILLLLWPIAQRIVTNGDPSVGVIDPNIWMLILLSLICFVIVIGLCWWVLQWFWLSLGLPDLGNMVLQFKSLESWQQLSFFWASFALLLLTFLGVLSAVI